MAMTSEPGLSFSGPPANARRLATTITREDAVRRRARLRIWSFVVALVLLAFPGGILLGHGIRQRSKPTRSPVELAGTPGGSPEPLVNVVVFIDHACSFCVRLHRSLTALPSSVSDGIRLFYRQYPRTDREESLLASRAALAARDQEQFWEMTDLLMSGKVSSDVMLLARVLRLDLGKFEVALAAPTIQEELDRDRREAERFGIHGTPVLFINGRRIDGHIPQDRLAGILTEEKQRALRLRRKGMSPAELYARVLKE
jgi:protein-disulfide isomerase